MKKIILCLILGVLVLGSITFVIAEGNFSCNTDSDCELKNTPYCCGENIEYYDSCFHVDEIPEDVNCTSTSPCPGIEAINTCTCVDSVCEGSYVEKVCDSDNLNLCTGQNECTNAGGFWYNSTCNVEEQEEPGNGEGTQVTKTKVRNRTSIKFVSWQKRNESECLEGCKCVGAVMSCPLEGGGKVMTIQAGRSGNIITITINKIAVNTSLEVETGSDGDNDTDVYAKLSDGRKAKLKIMPDVASERALERFRLKTCSVDNNCSIELKEVGSGNKIQLAYEIQVERHSKLLWMFRARMQVRAQVNAETGDIIRVRKPWWAFLASEPEE